MRSRCDFAGNSARCFRQALRYYLTRRFTTGATLQAAVEDVLFAIGDIYRVVASEWLTVNEYVSRELATIEFRLEREEPNIQDLELHLKDLFTLRRCCSRYHELITDARAQCKQRGRRSWPKSSSPIATENAKDLEEDFEHLQGLLQGTCNRIEKNIRLLTTLVAIGENKQGIEKNHGLTRLTLIATIFLPFSTLAAILGMQGPYSPVGNRFWVFWIVAVPITASVVTLALWRLKWSGKSSKVDLIA